MAFFICLLSFLRLILWSFQDLGCKLKCTHHSSQRMYCTLATYACYWDIERPLETSAWHIITRITDFEHRTTSPSLPLFIWWLLTSLFYRKRTLSWPSDPLTSEQLSLILIITTLSCCVWESGNISKLAAAAATAAALLDPAEICHLWETSKCRCAALDPRILSKQAGTEIFPCCFLLAATDPGCRNHIYVCVTSSCANTHTAESVCWCLCECKYFYYSGVVHLNTFKEDKLIFREFIDDVECLLGNIIQQIPQHFFL